MSHGNWLSCPICNSTDNKLILSLNCGNIDSSTLYSTIRLEACIRCGHVYNDLSPDEILGLANYYNSEYAPANLSSVITEGDRPGSADVLTVGRYDHLFQMLSSHLSFSDKILDVGCALGGFLSYLSRKSFVDLFGVDSTVTYTHRAQEENLFTIKHGNAENLPFADNMFDVVVVEQVLEHLVSPAKALREAFRVLKKGGIFCVGVPDASRYAGYYFFDFYWLLLREHIQHFDIGNLTCLAAREGFELLEYVQNDHAIMSSKMVMPNLCALFRKSGSFPVEEGRGTAVIALQEKIEKYVKQDLSRLEGKQRILKMLAADKRPVYVWGIGREFLYLYEAAGLKKCNIVGLIDMNPCRQNSAVDGIVIASQDQICNADLNAIVLIAAVAHVDSIKASLEQLGFSGEILILE
ncbi:class I SAM-dependent methyltransferase [Thiovibrio frasassiensis]|uniref:Class I SAM-dependent methyltransferase n=1 Tax=Thiovibrio frasassiensis TaxID=2984131 RepID=A0A9X4MH91_9BACT|nr:class I SAM-dependent methyltransferase [Thiovibrio frasassiensis]MDG4474799.1 class I SAM-dependent methyltransferase [Thiovibrio frasassiensis]